MLVAAAVLPAVMSSSDVDTDGDGLADVDELTKYWTDPNNPDTDGDGLTDGAEVLKWGTNPRKADTDGGKAPPGCQSGGAGDKRKNDYCYSPR